MPKNIEDIVVPERRRSIRNIPIPARKSVLTSGNGRRKSEKSTKFDELKKDSHQVGFGTENFVPPPSPPRFEMPPRPGTSRRRIRLILGVSILVVIFTTLSIFDGATLSYSPRSTSLVYDNEIFTAKKTADSGLLYSVIKLSGEKNLSVPASGEQEVKRKASGTIVVYNDASSESQRLIENTRFESPDGKIYRIQNDITIPGKKGSTPGLLEIVVYADEPGEEYNTGLVDFTVPGLKGTSRYTTIYARSKTHMSGGFIGVEKVVSKTDLTKAENNLRTLLSEELLAKAQVEVPSDFVLFPALSSVVFEELTQTGSNTVDSATVNLMANLYGVMFKRSDFARELSAGKTSISKEDSVEFKSHDALQISFADTKPADLLSVNEVSFKVSGSTKLLWLTDETSLKSNLAGLPKKDIFSVLSNYPTIMNASATIRPFWKSSFPNDPKKISIKRLEIE